MKIIFMGTPDFAVSSFRKIAASGKNIIAVVTQPDRPKGRGQAVVSPPMKNEALRHGIPVFQPEKVREMEFQGSLRDLAPDMIVVVAFGQIIPKSILDLPRLGCVNLHASLLPKYRGAAPIEYAIMKGEARTGNTTMLMDVGLDTGDILLQEEMDIPPEADALFLYKKLSEDGADLLLKTVEGLEKGVLQPLPQNNAEATFAPRLKKEDGLIRWDRENSEIVNQVRGLATWPVAYAFLGGTRIKIWKAEISPLSLKQEPPGKIVGVDHRGIHVSSAKGGVLLKEIQVEGKKRMAAHQFLQGHKIETGNFFE